MFSLIKKAVILVLMSESSVMTNKTCLLLKNQECKVRKVVFDNDYMTFPYTVKVDKCAGSCNDVENSYFKVCLPDSVKRRFHGTCKYSCLLDKKVCKNKQQWNKEKCRCECSEIKECGNNSFWNVVNCRCVLKKAAKLIVEEDNVM